MDEGRPTLEVERWCLGHRSIGARPLDLHEIESLRRESRRQWLRGFLPIPVYTVIAILATRAWAALPEGWEPMAGPAAGATIVFLWVGLATAILMTRDLWRAGRDASRDAAVARAECFGSTDDEDAAVPALAEIVLRSGSGRVLHGPPGMIGEVADVSHIAAGAREAWRIPFSMVDGTPAERRRLSAAEREELRRAIARWRRVRAGSVLAVIWVAVVAWGWGQREPGTIGFGDMMGVVASCVLCVWVLASNARRILASFAMERDLMEGVTLTVRDRFEEEVLPHSGVLWWVGGAPANWRDLGQS